MPDRAAIYREQPELYDKLISCEDYENNLIPALQSICRLEGAHVIEFGAGTGKCTAKLLPYVQSIIATEIQPAMAEVARRKLELLPQRNWQMMVADMRNVSLADSSADIALAGWCICFIATHEEDWKAALQQALTEMERVIRPGGFIMILETMGTGQTEPNPPTQRFAEYFEYLKEQGFQSKNIRTDYKFESEEEMHRLLKFFFDQNMLDSGNQLSPTVYPECTAMFWKQREKCPD
ncbi:MAG: class SAM-dependent methyltransferase [Candidatus Peribacteria bacterium]|nr:class SAM-dependent methyltransferase [Candidatus Peribacteria bacterium]